MENTCLTSLASEVYMDVLGSPNDTSVPAISHYFSTTLGTLNNYLDTLYYWQDEAHQILSACMTGAERAVWKQMYLVDYIARQYRKTLGAASYETIQSVQEGNRKVTKFSKTEIAKVYLQAKKDSYNDLLTIISMYKLNASKPAQVIINDFVMPFADGAIPYTYWRYIDSLE